MNLADLSIKRPVFVTCLVIIMLVLGYVSMSRLSVELFPDVSPPVVSILVAYPGTGPKEIETLVTKPVEDSVSTIAGIKRITAKAFEGYSQIIVEFFMDQDIKIAEQRIRDKVSEAKVKFPKDVKEPIVKPLDFGGAAIMTVALKSELPEAKAFDIADQILKPRIQQLRDVGDVVVLGGRKREIQVLLDRNNLHERKLSAGYVASRLAQTGANIPAGKIDQGESETVFRSRGEFSSIAEIGQTVLSLFGNNNPTRIQDVGEVRDALEDEHSRVFVDGKRALIIEIYKQSKTNTVALAERVINELPKLQDLIKADDPSAKLTLIRDGSRDVRLNIVDVQESIFLGIALTIVVVFLFLGNFRSTIITGLALPNSLLGSFILMQYYGLSINIVTLLALSLVVGLLIDDAIVVRENIFRHLERGEEPRKAARDGTTEVTLAVIATTLVVMSVFGPIALTTGLIGKILANFGLTICFAMAISLFDALTIAPMLSAYFAGSHQAESKNPLYRFTIGAALKAFDTAQSWLEKAYARLIDVVLRHSLLTIGATLAICVLCFSTLGKITKTFIPKKDAGEFAVKLELPQGSTLDYTHSVATKVQDLLLALPEIETLALTVGTANNESNLASFYVRIKPRLQRTRTLAEVKDAVRQQLEGFKDANPKVQDYDFTGGGMLRPLTLNILSDDTEALQAFVPKVLAKLKNDPRLKDVDMSYREGKKEFSFDLDPKRAQLFGMNTNLLGQELRAQVQGVDATIFREKGHEYDVRVLLKENQRDLKSAFYQTYVMNLNNNMIRLSDVATISEGRAQASIDRQNRSRYIQISGDLAPKAGIGDIISDISQMFSEGELKLLPGMRFALMGESESFQELATSMAFVLGLAITFIYLVLSSLYESFVTPFTIILTLPLALCGAFVALFFTGESINLFSVLGMLMLLGVSCKNSILLVDFTNSKILEGVNVRDAIREAGETRLRPILMTSLALIAGTFPIAIGLNEASGQRVSMGIAIIGGVISSTVLSLIVVPALLPYFLKLSNFADRAVKFVGGRA